MENLERTLDTSRVDMVEATGRVPTLQGAPEPARESPPLSHSAPEAANEWLLDEGEQAPGEEIVLSSPEEEPSGDLQLREIYSRETQVNIASVSSFIEAARAQEAPHVVSEEAYRACHTLAGSSRMAEARHGIRLTAPLEHWIRKSFDSGVGLDGTDLELLNDCMNAMQAVASNLDESTGFFQSHGALLARIEQATEELDSRIIAAARAAELAADPAPAPVVIATQPVPAAPAVAAPPASFPTQGPAKDLVIDPAIAEIVEDVVTDYDQDIASIFTDEAVELIDAAQGALAQWNENRSSIDGLAALKRPLHTLKGGARMAGLTPMGDLSHELETLFMQIDSGIIAADDRAFQLAQSALDELARMRESVSSGKGVTTARGLSARIQALSNPAAAAAPTVAGPVPVPAPAPAPAAAPWPAEAGTGRTHDIS